MILLTTYHDKICKCLCIPVPCDDEHCVNEIIARQCRGKVYLERAFVCDIRLANTNHRAPRVSSRGPSHVNEREIEIHRTRSRGCEMQQSSGALIFVVKT
jgi:hypothetical protein